MVQALPWLCGLLETGDVADCPGLNQHQAMMQMSFLRHVPTVTRHSCRCASMGLSVAAATSFIFLENKELTL